MTDEMMNLRALVEKSRDADRLRNMIGFDAESLVEMEVSAATGTALPQPKHGPSFIVPGPDFSARGRRYVRRPRKLRVASPLMRCRRLC